MIKRIKINPETEIKMLYDQLDVKESLIKNYMAEIEIQRQQLAIAVEALAFFAECSDWNDTYSEYVDKKEVEDVAIDYLKQIKELDK